MEWKELLNTTRIRDLYERGNPGLTTSDIAARRNKSLGTIKAQMSEIYRKLGVGNRAEAIAKATGLLETSPRPEDIPPK